MMMFLVLSLSAQYPIPPQPLRRLYQEAELVIVAKAGKSKQITEHSTNLEVMLQVEETVKGTAPGKEVRVYYAPWG